MSLFRVKIRQKFWITLLSISMTTLLLAVAALSHCALTLDQFEQMERWSELKNAMTALGVGIHRYGRSRDTSGYEYLSRHADSWERDSKALVKSAPLKEATQTSVSLIREFLNPETSPDRKGELLETLSPEMRELFYQYDGEYRSTLAAHKRSTQIIFIFAVFILVVFLALLTMLQRHVFLPLDQAYMAIVDSTSPTAEVFPIKS